MAFSNIIEHQNEIFGLISRSMTNLNKIGDKNLTKVRIEGRLKALEKHWDKFQENHSRLYEVKGDIENDKEAERSWKIYSENSLYEKCEDVFLDSQAEMMSLLEQFPSSGSIVDEDLLSDPGSNSDSLASHNSKSHKNYRLSRIDIVKFDGDFTKWLPFRDMFQSMVGEDKSLSNVEKFHYLKVNLVGSAAKRVENIPVTDDNFLKTWEELLAHYDNKRVLVDNYLDVILSAKPVSSESSKELERLQMEISQAISALNSLGCQTDSWNEILVYITVRKFDATTVRDWEREIGADNDPATWQVLTNFIEKKVKSLQAYERALAVPGQIKGVSRVPVKQNFVRSHAVSKGDNCPLCDNSHYISSCPDYQSKTIDQRKDLIRKHRYAHQFNCLGTHMLTKCRVQRRCQISGGVHHTSIHINRSISKAYTASVNSTEGLHNKCRDEEKVSPDLLATAVIKLMSVTGEMRQARVLLDSGSQVTIISENLTQSLGLSRSRPSLNIVGVGGCGLQSPTGEVELLVYSCYKSFSCSTRALILPKLSGCLPSQELPYQQWEHIVGLTLADPEFYRPKKIDAILGTRVYARNLKEGIRRGCQNVPIAQATQLGWIVSGPLPYLKSSELKISRSFQCSIEEELNGLLQKFWLQEEIFEISDSACLTEEEIDCENQFISGFRRDNTGRYIVRLPIRAPVSGLQDSFRSAARLLSRMEQRFVKNVKFYQDYSKFISEYEELGHMTRCSIEASGRVREFYLPHHGVVKENSATTKLRVVFNGSKKTLGGPSLNDCLHIGPKLLTNISDVLLRWRVYRFVFSADIAKMFRQILVDDRDRDLQRILWKSSSNSSLIAFRLNTVTYGTACAPYLANRTLHQLTLDEGKKYPLAVPIIRDETYVDNLYSGGDSETEVVKKIRDVRKLLTAGGFPLHQWVTNVPTVLQDLPKSELAELREKELNESLFQALGVFWNPQADEFVFQLRVRMDDSKHSKRSILSCIAQFYDPLGWLAPVLIRAKCFMQELWLIKLGWDDELPKNLQIQWENFIVELNSVLNFRIPRWLGLSSNVQSIELHGFCDASRSALGAVIYLRVVMNSGLAKVSLISGKTQVAPIQRDNSKLKTKKRVRVTTPRLELSAAVLLTKLMFKVQKTLRLENKSVFMWTDSSVALYWIRGDASRWMDFVQNRVKLIQQTIPNGNWHHVEGKSNPSDCASRGISPQKLNSTHLWWSGPDWLSKPSEQWPIELSKISEDVNLEMRKTIIVATIQCKSSKDGEIWDLINRYSSWKKLIQVTAWCFRFIDKVKRSSSENSRFITPAEISSANKFWVRTVQNCYFSKDLEFLQQNKNVKSSSTLIRLMPFVDREGILRVGGRLKNSLMDDDSIHQMILPRESGFTNLLIDDIHKTTLHSSTQSMLASLRRTYWILGARIAVRSFIRKSVVCTRYRAQRASQLMGQLPSLRVRPARPFLHSGIDYAAPFNLKTWSGRSRKTYKSYVALFVCLVSSAVHLEVVTDYTADAFIAAYRRFVGRRGICLVGSNTKLKELFSAASTEHNKIAKLLANDGTLWKFNPPSVPHFSGKWEAGVKSMKFHLRRVMGESILTYEEFSTLLIQIEAILNSRPMSPLSDDPDDVDALTPAHFLIGSTLSTIPEPSLIEEKMSRLSRWQLIQQKKDHFWKRWSTEYLQNLQTISKWTNSSTNISVGLLVLVVDEIFPPSKWPLGRITDVHPGADGLVRVVTVRTQTSTYKRPISKLCVLPVDEDQHLQGGRNV